ncbi:ATP-binding protein [Undibacterium sp. TJN19]|uniref:hybrid sensor histidine kinase/response regulator n=1 Tax=Undibacterium sp. TJN19 TaxID=3413055 RepID=UPI003BEFC8C5
MPEVTAVPVPSDEVLFQSAACGLLFADEHGKILRVNATLCNWLGYTAEELAALPRVMDLFPVGTRVFYQTHCLPLLQIQGSVAEVQFDIFRKDRKRLPILMNIVRRHRHDRIFDEFALFVATDRRSYERELLVARKTAEDALEARQGAEEQLQEINRQLSVAGKHKDEFLAILAHELRNPLAPMRNAVEIMKFNATGKSADTHPLEVLERQLMHMAHLVEDLMDVSRISQGRINLRSQPVDLASVIHGAVNDTRGMMADAAHVFTVNLPQETITVHGDATRLTQIVVNLLTNAAKYTPTGGHVWLTVSLDQGNAVISVRDTGIGIPKESLANVFTMFSQLVPALERSQGGLGIGLALVHGLVQLHGGSVVAFSEGAGKGSEFIVRLPAIQQLPDDHTPQQAAIAQADLSRKILVIDDNHDTAETMTDMLMLLGYDSRCAFDGKSGLLIAAEFKPSVILLDIGLPDMNGYEIARRVRAEPWGKSVYLIAATGWGQNADRQHALDAGFDSHLTKPVDLQQLQTLINQSA